jgi:steroid delta-isomerase-like uncharacterized protein
MSTEENEAIERRFFEAMNERNIASLDNLLAANFVDHNPNPGLAPDREGTKQFFAMTFAALPDFHSTLEDMITAGDKVVSRFTASGTHKGELMGIPGTGKRITMPGISIHRIAGGKIVDNWVSMDMLGMLQQLGVIPPLGQGGR